MSPIQQLIPDCVGSSRQVEAIRAHQKIQNSRPANYQPEVTIAHQIETDRFRLNISGRIESMNVWYKSLS